MEKLKFTFMPFAFVTLVGCATRTASTTIIGRDFDSSKISNITKGDTTSDQLVGLFGQPFSKSLKSENKVILDFGWVKLNKSVESEDEMLWDYSWVKTTFTTNMGWISPNIKTDGYKKDLKVLVKNGVVVDYTLDEGLFHTKRSVEVPDADQWWWLPMVVPSHH